MEPIIEVNSIGHVIQLSVAPVFLLAGVGAMLGVLSNRLARTVDRARNLEGRYAAAAAAATATAPEQDSLRRELRVQARRCRLIYVSMSLCTLCALLICSVIVALFASAFVGAGLPVLIAVLFVAAMLAFIAALLVFLREVHLATTNLRIGPP